METSVRKINRLFLLLVREAAKEGRAEVLTGISPVMAQRLAEIDLHDFDRFIDSIGGTTIFALRVSETQLSRLLQMPEPARAVYLQTAVVSNATAG